MHSLPGIAHVIFAQNVIFIIDSIRCQVELFPSRYEVFSIPRANFGVRVNCLDIETALYKGFGVRYILPW